MVFLCRQVGSNDALMLVGLSDDVLLERRVPNDMSLRGRGFRQCVVVVLLKGLMMPFFQYYLHHAQEHLSLFLQ